MRILLTTTLYIVDSFSAFAADKPPRLLAELKPENDRGTFIICLSAIILAAMAISYALLVRRMYLKKLKIKDEIIERQNAELAGVIAKLDENARFKEEYIGYFFSTISSYLLKIEKIRRSVERKIMVKKYDDILQSFHELNVRKERENMFHTFDNAFLKIFPDFIFIFNSMLPKQDQVCLGKSDGLSTDVRIFALMRLGIGDCETIASILEYSVNTIYVYKMRLKAKAIVPGDEFEQAIMSIKAVSYNGPEEYRESA